jgi:hypothetical protein
MMRCKAQAPSPESPVIGVSLASKVPPLISPIIITNTVTVNQQRTIHLCRPTDHPVYHCIFHPLLAHSVSAPADAWRVQTLRHQVGCLHNHLCALPRLRDMPECILKM